ncbi:MAG: STAS domain-containing protein [Oscillospiraceae bacterium]|nr:STAS domain-containing protein [Oscillospiraceae bacterium]
MPLKLYTKEKQVIACLAGEIDHHGAGRLREEIDETLERVRPDRLILDFRDVTFMDSSGIGLVMGRYRLIREWEGAVEIHNPSPSIKKVMRLAGLDRIASIHSSPPQSGVNSDKTEAKV